MFLLKLWRKIILYLFRRENRATALIYNVQTLAHQTGTDNPETPERLTRILDIVNEDSVKKRLKFTHSEIATENQVSRVHPPNYINYLESLLPNEGLRQVDSDTVMSRDTLSAAYYAAGAVVKAVDMVIDGRAINAFCLIRPPGHHAKTNETHGFCFLNNIAIGAMHALTQYRLKKVAIIDFDAHHGDGTEEIFKDDERVMFISSYQHPLFPFRDETTLLGSNPNIILSPLKVGSGTNVIRHIVEKVWLPKLKLFKPEMIFISAGFDAHKDDFQSHLNFTETDFAWITEKLVYISHLYAKGRIVSALEGGYNLDSLGPSALAHIKAMAE